MSADWEMRFPLDMIPAQLEAATPIALARAAEALRAVAVAQLGDWAFPTIAAAGPAPDLAYVHLLADVRESFISDEDQLAVSAATVTLQRREGEWWRVLAFGVPASEASDTVHR